MPESTQDQSDQRQGQTGSIREAPSTSSSSQDVDHDVRQAAERHGVDLTTLKGTGENGKITVKDVEAARSGTS